MDAWFDLGAVEAVCGADSLDAYDVDHLLDELSAKSMVSVAAGRFRVLESLRQFGAERLEQRGDTARFRDAHLDHYLGFAIEGDAGLHTREEGVWSARFEANWANLRAAFGWAHESENLDAALALVNHVTEWAFWRTRPEFRDWAMIALDLPGVADHDLYASVLGSAAFGAQVHSDFTEEARLAEVAIEAESHPGAATDYRPYGALFVVTRDADLASQVRGFAQRDNHTDMLVWALAAEGNARTMTGAPDAPEPHELSTQATLLADSAAPTWAAFAHLQRGWAYTYLGRHDMAASDYRQAAHEAALGGSTWIVHMARNRAVLSSHLAGDPQPPELEWVRQALEVFANSGNWAMVNEQLITTVAALDRDTDPRLAQIWHAWRSALEHQLAWSIWGPISEQIEQQRGAGHSRHEEPIDTPQAARIANEILQTAITNTRPSGGTTPTHQDAQAGSVS